MSNRERDLGRRLSKIGQRVEQEGQRAAQRFYDWEREPRLPEPDSTRGGGNGGTTPASELDNRRAEHQASRLRAQWQAALRQAITVCERLEWLLEEAKAQKGALEPSQRTPTQVEADGWCGSCWTATKALVPIALRSSGEPYYKGRCRFCGSWPNGDPPRDVLQQRHSGKTVRVSA